MPHETDPVFLHQITPQDYRQVLDALRDLLIASDKHNTGSDPELVSAFHQARQVLSKNLNFLT